jgi:intein/homing endonuclease
MLFQINRQGVDEADKNEGRYKAKALSYSNECLVSGTITKSHLGLVPIETVSVGDRVWSSTGWKQVLATFDQGVRETFEVNTRYGFRITTTGGHRLRVLDDGEVKWVEVKDLLPGQHYVLGDFATRPFSEKLPALPPLEFEVGGRLHGKHGDLSRLIVPKQVNSDLAYLMGAYEGDGVAGNEYKLGFTGNRAEVFVRERVEATFLRCFGQSLSTWYCPSRPGSFDMTKSSKALKRWFVAVGMDRQPGVPPTILKAPRDCVIAYLKGFWDTDGSINSQNILYLGQKAANRQTLQEVQLLMSDLGIETTLEDGICKLKGKKYPKSVLRVRTKAGRRLFADLIGFTEPRKAERLKRSLRSREVNRTLWPVSGLYLELFDAYSMKRDRHISRDKIRFPRSCVVTAKKLRDGKSEGVPEESVRLLVEALREKEDPRVNHLKWLLANTRPYLVTAVTPKGPQHVYDLEVTGDHEYATAGFLSHNCERSADVITTTYLNEEHRKNGTTLFCNLKNRDNPIVEPFEASVDFSSRRLFNLEGIAKSGGPGMGLEDHQTGITAMFNV